MEVIGDIFLTKKICEKYIDKTKKSPINKTKTYFLKC